MKLHRDLRQEIEGSNLHKFSDTIIKNTGEITRFEKYLKFMIIIGIVSYFVYYNTLNQTASI